MKQKFPLSLFHRFFSKEKPFGYHRSMINLVHWMYWVLADHYHSKMLTVRWRVFWILFNVTNNMIFYLFSLSYPIFTTNPSLSNLLLFGTMLMTGIYLTFLIPMAAYISRNRTIEAFKILDQKVVLLSNGDQSYSSQVPFIQRKKYSMNTAIYLALTQITNTSCYVIIAVVDFLMEYSTAKLSNPNYYVYPMYCEPVQNFGIFLLLLCLQTVAASPIMLRNFFFPFFIVVIVVEFYRKFQTVCDLLDHQSRLFTYQYEKLLNASTISNDVQNRKLELEHLFMQNILTCVKFHQQLIK